MKYQLCLMNFLAYTHRQVKMMNHIQKASQILYCNKNKNLIEKIYT